MLRPDPIPRQTAVGPASQCRSPTVRPRAPLARGGRSVPLPVVPVAGLIDHDRAGKDEHVVLALGDVDAVRVGQGEPPLRDGRHVAVAAAEDVLVVEEVALRLEVVGSGRSEREHQ